MSETSFVVSSAPTATRLLEALRPSRWLDTAVALLIVVAFNLAFILTMTAIIAALAHRFP